MKVAFISDSSESFVSFQRDLVLENWGEKSFQNVSDLSNVGSVSLFGDSPVSVLNLESPAHSKKLLEEIKSLLEEGTFESRVSSGLIITSTLNKNSTRSLQKVLEPFSEIYSTKAGEVGKSVVSHMHLNREAKEFLLNYLGQDYSVAIPLARSIRNLPVEEQKSITVQNLYYRLPKPPGSIPPWEIEKPIMRGDIQETVAKYRRIVENGASPLLPVSVLSNKFKLIFKVAEVLEGEKGLSVAQVASSMGVPNNYPLKLAVQAAKKLGVGRAEKIVLELSELERKLKGGGSGPIDATVEMSLINVALLAGK